MFSVISKRYWLCTIAFAFFLGPSYCLWAATGSQVECFGLTLYCVSICAVARLTSPFLLSTYVLYGLYAPLVIVKLGIVLASLSSQARREYARVVSWEGGLSTTCDIQACQPGSIWAAS